MSLFAYGIEVWGSALEKKYLERIDKFLRRAYKYGYTTKSVQMIDVIKKRDMSLFEKYVVTQTTLYTNYFLIRDKDR
jgi:hypothetical protein